MLIDIFLRLIVSKSNVEIKNGGKDYEILFYFIKIT